MSWQHICKRLLHNQVTSLPCLPLSCQAVALPCLKAFLLAKTSNSANS